MNALVERTRLVVLGLVVAYPFVDFALRKSGLPVLPSLWDEAVLVLGLALVARRLRAGAPLRLSPVLRPIGLFMAVAAANVLADLPHLSIGLEGLRADFEYMAALLIALNLVDEPRDLHRSVYAMVGLGSLAAAHGLYQYVTNAPMPPEWVSVTESLRTRAYSIVGSPNGLGDYLALLVPLAVGWAFYERSTWRRAALLAAGGVIVAGLLSTFSRGAWLGLAAAGAVVAHALNRRLVPVLLLAAVALGVAVPPVRERMVQLVSPSYLERATVPGGRLFRWNEAYKQMAHSPLTGAGVGQWGGAVAARRLGVIYTDNYYAKTMAESGLPGLVAFVALMGSCAALGARVCRSLGRRRERLLALGLWGALLVVIVHNAVENIFEIPFLNAYFWFLAGLLTVLPVLVQGDPAGDAVGARSPGAPAAGGRRS